MFNIGQDTKSSRSICLVSVKTHIVKEIVCFASDKSQLLSLSNFRVSTSIYVSKLIPFFAQEHLRLDLVVPKSASNTVHVAGVLAFLDTNIGCYGSSKLR